MLKGTAACENFDTRIFTRIAANLSQTYAPLTTTVDTITDCLNQTVFGTPQLGTYSSEYTYTVANPSMQMHLRVVIEKQKYPFL